jgi:hypothetical protein
VREYGGPDGSHSVELRRKSTRKGALLECFGDSVEPASVAVRGRSATVEFFKLLVLDSVTFSGPGVGGLNPPSPTISCELLKLGWSMHLAITPLRVASSATTAPSDATIVFHFPMMILHFPFALLQVNCGREPWLQVSTWTSLILSQVPSPVSRGLSQPGSVSWK